MKNMKFVKTVIMILVVLTTIFIGGQVLADNETDNNYVDLSPTTNTSTGGNNTGATNNTATLNSATNRANTLNTSAITNNTSNRNNTSNTSNYANTSLPSTGIESSVPVVLVIVIFGISAIYAYKKIKDYRNI